MMAAADPENLLTVMRETSFGQGLGRSSRAWRGSACADIGTFERALDNRVARRDAVGELGARRSYEDQRWCVVGRPCQRRWRPSARCRAGGTAGARVRAYARATIPSAENTAHTVAALVSFSGMGYAAVAVLIGSGLVNAWLLVGPPTRLLTTPYGQLLLVKVCLLTGMLALAVQNRFRLVPALQTSKESCQPSELLLQALHRNGALTDILLFGEG